MRGPEGVAHRLPAKLCRANALQIMALIIHVHINLLQVLLAAVLRADNIPSRVCSGLVYTEAYISDTEGSCVPGDSGCDEKKANKYTRNGVRGSFAWHAWTQAMIDGAWVDVDATLHNSPYSVGHLLMGTSSLSDASGHADEMMLVSLIGNLKITVDKVE